MKVLGIDDAGRGPVIGPMILAGVLAEESEEEKIKEWGAKDSKLLTKQKRAELEKIIKENYETVAIITNAKEIDEYVLNKTNLNTLEAKKSAAIINEFLKDKNEKIKVIIDCPSPNTLAWKAIVLNFVEKTELIEIYCEHKADLNHPIVSAASIIAKETREREIAKIKTRINQDFGSGYCHDPKTCKFLEEFFDDLHNSRDIRKSWDTWTTLVSKKEQKDIFEF